MKFEKSMKTANKKRTICEVIREVNDTLNNMQTGNYYEELAISDIRDLIEQIHDMAKRMTKKLYSYSKEWDAEFWKANPDYEQDLLRRLK